MIFRALKSRSENVKRGFLSQNNIGTPGTPHSFQLKSGQNAEISHTNHILSRHFQGAF